MTEIKTYPVTDQNVEVVGQTQDFYFDDLAWTVRYLVVDIGGWLPGRKVLISPVALEPPDIGGGISLRLKLTREQIEQSPSIDTDKPVSRQQEAALIDYYRWPYYWQDATFFGVSTVGLPSRVYLDSVQHQSTTRKQEGTEAAAEQTGDPHLRSANEVRGYYIQARDGDIGHVEDFLVDDESWAIHYLVVDTRNWWPSKKVLASPSWVEKIIWSQSQVSIDLNRETIKNSPEYDPSAPVDRAYETQLYDYYQRPKYW